MSRDLLPSLLAVAKAGGDRGIAELLEALGDLRPKDPLQRAALAAITEAVARLGPSALNAAIGDIGAILDGDPFDPDELAALTARGRSDVLAQLQVAEARRGDAKRYLDLVGASLGRILAVAGKVALASAV